MRFVPREVYPLSERVCVGVERHSVCMCMVDVLVKLNMHELKSCT